MCINKIRNIITSEYIILENPYILIFCNVREISFGRLIPLIVIKSKHYPQKQIIIEGLGSRTRQVKNFQIFFNAFLAVGNIEPGTVNKNSGGKTIMVLQ